MKKIVYEQKTAGEKAKIIAEFAKKRYDDETGYDKSIQDSNAKVYDERMKNIGKSLETLSAATNDESDMMSGLAEEEIKRQRKALESANISIENRKKLLDELDKYEIKINADREKRAEESAAKLVASAQKEAEEKLKAAKGKSSEGGVEITDAESESVKNFISGEKQKLEAMEINADKKRNLLRN